MKTSWLSNVEEERKKDIKVNFNESLVMRLRLQEMLSNKLDSNLSHSRAKSNYENPNWANSQADSIGYQRALQEVIELIS